MNEKFQLTREEAIALAIAVISNSNLSEKLVIDQIIINTEETVSDRIAKVFPVLVNEFKNIKV